MATPRAHLALAGPAAERCEGGYDVNSPLFMPLMILYELVAIGTFVYKTFFDGYVYNSWNWLIAIPVNMFLAEIWPIYWGIIRWIPTF